MEPLLQSEIEAADRQYPHVVRFVQDTPWAILPSALDTIVEVVRFRAAGGRLTEQEVAERLAGTPRAAQPRPSARLSGDIAVLPLFGMLSQRASIMTQMSGGTSTEQFGQLFSQALAAADVGVIVLDVDSPGGAVFGIEELGNVIFSARGRKPVIAVANSLAASAAYWLASQADEIVVTPSGQVGAIGVLGVHEDLSVRAEREGVKVTYVSAGRFKTEGQPFQPLSEEAREAMQRRVDDYYQSFVRAVARGRRVTQREVREGFAEGRVAGAAQALRLGMVDRIATLEETVARFQQPGAVAAMRAEARLRELDASDPAYAMSLRRARLQAAASGALPALPPRRTEEPVPAPPEPKGVGWDWLRPTRAR